MKFIWLNGCLVSSAVIIPRRRPHRLAVIRRRRRPRRDHPSSSSLLSTVLVVCGPYPLSSPMVVVCCRPHRPLSCRGHPSSLSDIVVVIVRFLHSPLSSSSAVAVLVFLLSSKITKNHTTLHGFSCKIDFTVWQPQLDNITWHILPFKLPHKYRYSV